MLKTFFHASIIEIFLTILGGEGEGGATSWHVNEYLINIFQFKTFAIATLNQE